MDAHRHGEAFAVPPNSLVALAARKALPEHQYMDAATVAWIASQRGDIPDWPRIPILTLPPIAWRVVESAPIPPSWHAEPRLAESIHGTRHLLRTAALAAVLADLHQLDEHDTATLVIAATVHDCRRVHDKDDTGHGERGATWLIEHAPEVFRRFGVDSTPERAQTAAVAVRLHEVPYVDFTDHDTTDHAAAEAVSDLLKTADALDRYRLPKRTWWPRNEFLHVIAPSWLHRLAFELVVETETARLDTSESAKAVRTVLRARDLL